MNSRVVAALFKSEVLLTGVHHLRKTVLHVAQAIVIVKQIVQTVQLLVKFLIYWTEFACLTENIATSCVIFEGFVLHIDFIDRCVAPLG